MTALAETWTDGEQSLAAGFGSVSRRSRRAILRRLDVSWWPILRYRNSAESRRRPDRRTRVRQRV